MHQVSLLSSARYNGRMEYEIISTLAYKSWLRGLRDGKARALIANRMTRLAAGHFGDCKPVGDGVFELRFFYATGYRIYYAREGGRLIVLLTGGDKSSQQRDIARAKEIWMKWRENWHES